MRTEKSFEDLLAAIREHKGKFCFRSSDWIPPEPSPHFPIRHRTMTDSFNCAACPIVTVFRTKTPMASVYNGYAQTIGLFLGYSADAVNRVIGAADRADHPDRPALMEACL